MTLEGCANLLITRHPSVFLQLSHFLKVPWFPGIHPTAKAGSSEAPSNFKIRLSEEAGETSARSGHASDPIDFASQMRARVNAARDHSTRPRDLPNDNPHSKPPSSTSRPQQEQTAEDRTSDDDDDEEEEGGGGSSRGGEASAGGAGATGSGSGKPDYSAERKAELQSQREDQSGLRTYGRVKITSEVTDADLLKPWQVHFLSCVSSQSLKSRQPLRAFCTHFTHICSMV